MKPQDVGNRESSVDQRRGTRNPFGVMDVPNPNDQEVLEFAAGAMLAGMSDDENAKAWAAASLKLGMRGGPVRKMLRRDGKRRPPA
jgi:hypothetical protein